MDRTFDILLGGGGVFSVKHSPHNQVQGQKLEERGPGVWDCYDGGD